MLTAMCSVGLVSETDGTGSVSTLKDYTSLSSRVNAASPSSTSMDAYTATNSAAACPAVGTSWQASDLLPPTPDATLCECMYNSLTCVPSSSIDTDAYSDIYGYICAADESYCAGVTGNSTTGVYGAYSMCNSTQMLGYILDQYYQGQGADSSACSFSGDAVTQAAATASSCSSQLASASSANAIAATATAGSTSSGSSTKSSSSSSSLAMPSMQKMSFNLGNMAIGLYVVVAMGAGAAMVGL